MARPARAVRETSAAPPPAPETRVSPELTSRLIEACAAARPLRVVYRPRPAGDGQGDREMEIEPWAVVLRHALRNCAIPIVTALGLELGNLLGGAVITEAVFAYPGIGRLAVEAVVNKDVPLIQAVVLTVASAVLLLNILIDVVYVFLDPRIRLA